MAKIHNASEELGFTQKPLRTYTASDFPKVHERLKKYWTDGKFLKSQFLVDCGALNEQGAVIVQNIRQEVTKGGHYVTRVDEPTTLRKAYNLLDWYMREFKNYPRLDIRKELVALQSGMSFDVRPLLDDENHHRANVKDEPF